MEQLEKVYADRLDAIAKSIQESEFLEEYLEDEEEEPYKALIEDFEPEIESLYLEVADQAPMQIVALEKALLDDRFEGLYLPRILGFSVLRGIINDQYKYIHPQDMFKEVILTIASSPNFEIIQGRIGQGIQVGFALSSDIWITNIINTIQFKKVRQFLIAQKVYKYRDLNNRRTGYVRYKKQFEDLNFYTAEFPENANELKIYYPSLKQFIVERIKRNKENSSIHSYVVDFVKNDDLPGSLEYVYLFGLFVNYLNLSGEEQEQVKERFNVERKEINDFNEKYFVFLQELLESNLPITADCDKRVSATIDRSIKDDLSMYYDITDIIHSKGYVHEDTQEAVREFYYSHEGLSIMNECLRLTILNYVNKLISGLEPEDYKDLMEIYNTFISYMNIFQNEKFDQAIKHKTLQFAKRFIKVYTDKRARDYQDFKKFITATFLDLDFMKEKDIKDFFATKKKRKA